MVVPYNSNNIKEWYEKYSEVTERTISKIDNVFSTAMQDKVKTTSTYVFPPLEHDEYYNLFSAGYEGEVKFGKKKNIGGKISRISKNHSRFCARSA